MGTMYVMGASGDTRVVWDIEQATEVAVAKRTFTELKSKGYLPFRAAKQGERGQRITDFDPTAHEILFVAPIAGG